MIRRQKSGSWWFRGALAAGVLGFIGLGVLWSRTSAPGVGFPDSDIRPLFAPTLSEAPSRKRHAATGSIYDSIEPVKEAKKPIHAIFVYVHGISCHSPDYSAPFQFRLAKSLGMTREKPANGEPRVSVIDLTTAGPMLSEVSDYLSTEDFDAWSATPGPAEVKSNYLRVRRGKKIPKEFASACSNTESGVLVQPLEHPRLSIRHFASATGDRASFVEVLWSPISERQKLVKVGEDLNLDASALRSRPPWQPEKPARRADVEQRAMANQMLKASVINGAIADAIFYLGDGGPEIRAAVMAGILQAIKLQKETEAAGKQNVRMTVVTESLGSRIAFDTMREASDRFSDQLDETIGLLKSLPRVVMFANQLPLLDIATQPDRSLANNASFETVLARHRARINLLVEAGDQEAGQAEYAYSTRSDPPSWRACGEAFQYYVRAVEALNGSGVRARIVGRSATEMADNVQFSLTHPALPVMAVLDGAQDAAKLPETLQIAKKFTKNAMGFLGFSPGGIGYANCQTKVTQERAKVEAFYESSNDGSSAKTREEIARSERLLKIVQDVRASNIADIDAISNSRASVVFALLYLELEHLSAACAKPSENVSVCNAAAIQKRLARVARLVPRIEVLAFSDPNDLLSYRVTAEQYESETFNFINIPIRLADPIVPAAGRWGGFTPPMEAHTNHKFDNRILAMVVCGWDKARRRTFETVNGKPCPLQLGQAGQ